MTTECDLIEQAFTSAIAKFKKELKDESLFKNILATASINQVYDATEELQKEQAEKGHLRNLAKIKPYLTRLTEYAQAIEVFIQVKPDVLALIWGPIKLLLQFASVLKTSFDAIVDVIAEIGQALPQFKVIAKMFSDSDTIKNLLLLFFNDILDFYHVAFKFFALSRWRFFFEALWPSYRDKIKEIASLIRQHTLLMRNETTFMHIQQQHEERQRALKRFEDTEKANLRLEYQAIKTDISPIAYEHDLYRFQTGTCHGTGAWLPKNKTFEEWIDSGNKSKRVLWLQGIPGAGKTFLASTVVRELQPRGKTIYAFLTHTMSNNTTALSVLHSLIFQMADNDDFLQAVLCKSDRAGLKSDADKAIDSLKTLLACCPQVYIIMDGMDEIEGTERCRLTKHLIDLTNTHDNTNILISSRPEADLEGLLGKKVADSIRVDIYNMHSIQTFVDQWMVGWLQERHGLSNEERCFLMDWLAPLASKSKGMFLYAKIVLSSIKDLYDMAEIEEEIRVLPEDLDAAYSRILSRPNNSRDKHKVRKLLGWIASSPTPLRLHEIQHAISIKENDLRGDRKVFGIIPIVQLCGPIVEIIDDYIYFVHFTVKEYIQSPNIKGYIDDGEAVISLTSACLTYLSQEHHEPGLSSEEVTQYALSGAYSLHEFATGIWLELLERCLVLEQARLEEAKLFYLLDSFVEDRRNDKYTNADNRVSQYRLRCLKKDWPDLHDMMVKCAGFRQVKSSTSHAKVKGSMWTALDPLTISDSSIAIYDSVESILKCDKEHSDKDPNCRCTKVRILYGNKPFKCKFLHCEHSRYGFRSISERRSHERYHDRPWKCSVATCEYAEGGFLSRAMRDSHLDHYHQDEEAQLPVQRHEDNSESLLLELAACDDVEGVTALMSSIEALSDSCVVRICEVAAAQGATSVLRKVFTFDQTGKLYRDQSRTKRLLAMAAVENDQVEIVEFLLKISEDIIGNRAAIAGPVLEMGSPAMVEILATVASIDDMTLHGPNRWLNFWRARKDPKTQENVILLWEKVGVFAGTSRDIRNKLLINCARVLTSPVIMKSLIDAVVDIDYQGGRSLTALEILSQSTSRNAAEMMKLLLEHGADPDVDKRNSGSTKAIGEKAGARNISKWIGISWEELVQQTRKYRQ